MKVDGRAEGSPDATPATYSGSAPTRLRDATLLGLLILAILYTLYFVSDLFIPITLAVFIKLLFSRPVRYLEKRRVPAWMSAALIVVGVVGLTSLLISGLSTPAEKWLAKAPQTLSTLTYQTGGDSSLEELSELSEQIESIAQPDGSDQVQRVVMQGPGLTETLLGGIPYAVQFLAIVLFLSFFLLASGDALLRKLVTFAATVREKRRVVRIFRRIETEIANYLGTVAIINAGLGCITGLVMALLGVPNPELWGVMVALFNFAPYLGALASLVVLSIVGFSTFPDPLEAMLVPASFLVLTAIEGQLLSPLLHSKRLALSPAVVFLSVVIWGWLWGVAGALLAVPIVASIKVVFENNRRLRPVAKLLGD